MTQLQSLIDINAEDWRQALNLPVVAIKWITYAAYYLGRTNFPATLPDNKPG